MDEVTFKCRKTMHGVGGGAYDVIRVVDGWIETTIGSVRRCWNAETGSRGQWINSRTGESVKYKTKGEAVEALAEHFRIASGAAG